VNNVNIPTKKAYHHGNLRAALVAAALKEIAKSGPESFSLREVARRAGVSAPAVYRHFKDKDALLAAVAGECWEQIGAAMTAAVAEAPADDVLEQFRATGIAYVKFAVEHPEHFRAMSIPGLSARLPQEQLAQATAWSAKQREEIQRAQAAGKIAAIPIEDLMLAASSMVHGVAQQIVEGRFGKVDVARATELAVIATGVLGLGFWPRSEPARPDTRRRR
jgi:AcrR family transcriptional regulator